MPQATAATACRPWCTEHINGTPTGLPRHPEDQVCVHRTHSAAFGELTLTYTVADGPMVNLYNAREDLTLAQAEQFAYALLALVVTAREVTR